jgi:2'-5' RNA ligase
MRHRIFIAINLPKEIKEVLIQKIKKIEESFNFYKDEFSFSGPLKWVKPDNLHLTLAFLGYVKDEDLPKIIEMVKEISKKHSPFSVNFLKISYSEPKHKIPRMIWVVCEKNKELFNLQEDLKKSLLSFGITDLETERDFLPHITLARIKKWEFRKIDPEKVPEVNEPLNLSFEVKSIEIMESHLKREGAEYTVLESCPLKE